MKGAMGEHAKTNFLVIRKGVKERQRFPLFFPEGGGLATQDSVVDIVAPTLQIDKINMDRIETATVVCGLLEKPTLPLTPFKLR